MMLTATHSRIQRKDGEPRRAVYHQVCTQAITYSLSPPVHIHRHQPLEQQADVAARSGVVLEKVCEYLYYNQKHAESKDVPDMEIEPQLCLELLIAADYLDGEFPCSAVGIGCFR